MSSASNFGEWVALDAVSSDGKNAAQKGFSLWGFGDVPSVDRQCDTWDRLSSEESTGEWGVPRGLWGDTWGGRAWGGRDA